MGWLASLFTLIGLLLNARKVRASWLIWIVGDTLWIFHAWAIDWAIVALNVMFLYVNFYGYKKWSPDAPAPVQAKEPAHPVAIEKLADRYPLEAAADDRIRCVYCGRKDCYHFHCIE